MQTLDAEALYRLLFSQLVDAYGADLGRPEGVALVGIRSGGAWLANRLAADLGALADGRRAAAASGDVDADADTDTDDDKIDLGIVNVSLHRDDFASKGLHSHHEPTQLPFDVAGRRILLIDDVLYTGRTIRAALNELYEFGRPASVELAVLVDRGGHELPFYARFVGEKIDIEPGRTVVLARDPGGRFTFDAKSRLD